jgi:GT2 family glycosyltransferase
MADPKRVTRVSVVIPVFNSAHLVGTALTSVFAQTFRDFEVIVVDDGSEDHDELNKTLAGWAERILCIRQLNGGGQRAQCRHRARDGELVAFLDADDEWLPEKLARQVEYFQRTGNRATPYGRGRDTSSVPALPAAPRHMFCELFHTAFFVNTLTVMVPRRALIEVGGFDERREIHVEDWDLWLRIAAQYPMGYIREPLALHRPGGLMSRQVERTYAAQALVIDKSRALCRRACAMHRQAPARCDRKRRHVLHRDWGYDRLEAGDWRGAREQLGLALTYEPWHARTGLLFSPRLPAIVGEGAGAAQRRSASARIRREHAAHRRREELADERHSCDEWNSHRCKIREVRDSQIGCADDPFELGQRHLVESALDVLKATRAVRRNLARSVNSARSEKPD